MKRRMIALLLVLVLVLGALAGCGQKQEEGKQPEPQKQEEQKEPEKEKDPEPAGPVRKTTTSQAENSLRVVMNSEIHTLDPNHYMLINESSIITLLYDTLMIQNENYDWEPWVATDMEANEDGSEVIVTIRDDIYFNSGDKMTAEDIVYSLSRTENSSGVPYVYEYSSMEIIDDTHIRWSFPYAADGAGYNELSDFANSLPIFNKSYCETIDSDPSADLLFNVDGSGAYVIESIQNGGMGDVVVKKAEDHWNEYGYMDKIIFKYLTGDAEMAFEAGDVDYSGYTYETFQTIKEYANVQPKTEFSGNTTYIICNCAEDNVFNDIRMREAVQWAFDRDELAQVMTANSGETAWQMFTPKCQFFEDCVPHRQNDKDKARALMKECGYSESNRCKINVLVMSSASWLAASEVLKENLDQCYFDCTIVETAEYTPYSAGDFDLGLMGISLNNNFVYYGMMMDIDSGLDDAFYVSDDAKDLAKRIAGVSNQADATRCMQEFDAIMAYCPIGYRIALYAFDDQLEVGPYVGGYRYDTFKWK